ncbi:MAG TPA: hypothetical protein VJ064_07925, partial [Limnochordia bacterium]|nr:hypothetical protein [Limnochordia bacterium]
SAADAVETRAEAVEVQPGIDSEKEPEAPAKPVADKPVKESEPMPVEDAAALLAKLGSANKRKSWEERFGSLSITEDGTIAPEQKEPEPEQLSKKTKKKKKAAKVIKDFSMLAMEDFQFDDQE